MTCCFRVLPPDVRSKEFRAANGFQDFCLASFLVLQVSDICIDNVVINRAVILAQVRLSLRETDIKSRP